MSCHRMRPEEPRAGPVTAGIGDGAESGGNVGTGGYAGSAAPAAVQRRLVDLADRRSEFQSIGL